MEENLSTTKIINDTKKEYYAKQFTKLNEKSNALSWNWACFFFGPFWMIYRKMFANGLVVLALYIIASLLGTYTSNNYFYYFITLMSVTLPVFANKAYYSYYKKISKKAEGFSNDEKENYLTKKLGTSMAKSIITAVVASLISGIIATVMLMGGDPLAKFEPQAEGTKSISLFEFYENIKKQPVYVSDTDLIYFEDPDTKEVQNSFNYILTNNTNSTIKNAVVAFIAWDNNNKPVTIKVPGEKEASIIEVKEEYNIAPGKNSGEDFIVDYEGDNIGMYEAIVVSYETADGKTWTNPYYDTFKNGFLDKKYSEFLKFNLPDANDDYERADKIEEGTFNWEE